ncbi:MAG: sterol desaturase family protein [Desulfuromonadaceae bacterium]|nr:sterol desaturase family protein [Desulfuromonadaceae bacterium]MDD5107193.1 sterol desaturase family protein [Desulfuromonadaceae bacterium]
MTSAILAKLPEIQDTIRLATFLSLFLILALAERIRPRRPLTVQRARRWQVNWTLVLFNSLLIRYLIPVTPFGIAVLARSNQWGIFNQFTVPEPFEIVATLLFLDLVIYLQHRLFHRFSLFWRLHRMHHIDLDLDVSSGTRFHPLEIMLSLIIKIGATLLLGASPPAVLLFEVLLNATAMFSHANMRLPLPVDRWLRLFVVTPDMHRVHHSVLPRETDSNFGFNLPWWDRLLGTYRAEPKEGHDRMSIGLKEFREFSGIWLSLKNPFTNVRNRR